MKNWYCIGLLNVLLSVGCAKIGVLTGGEKDIDPPLLLKTEPKNKSINFDSKKIEVTFDEYIQLKDASQQLIISPPMSKKPTITMLGKAFSVEFKDTLKPNTTYCLNFGKSITDNNEGNVFDNFRYVFSTGTYIDSLSTKGNLLNAFDLSPDKKDPFLLMLHENIDDTAIYKSLPSFVARTNVANGDYRFENLHEGNYHLYAIKDANNNFKYDPYSEPIAFIDSIFEFKYDKLPKDTDTVVAKKLPELLNKPVYNNKKDGKQKEIKKAEKKIKEIAAIDLPQMYFFTEFDTKQIIKSTDRKDKRKLDVVFSNPLDEKFSYKLLGADSAKTLMMERNRTNDTLIFWVLDSTMYKSDSIKMSFTYNQSDSNRIETDTVRFNFFEDKTDTKKTKKSVEKDKLAITPTSGGTIDLNTKIVIKSNFPIEKTDTTFIHLKEKIDTLEFKRKFKIDRDSINSRIAYIQYPWKPETSYKLELFPGGIIDCFNLLTDTLKLNYSAQKTEFYGVLILKVKNVKSPVIIQVYEKLLIKECCIFRDTTLRFEMMKPATYSFKAIFDNNKNKKWDTGNLKKKIQPEKVLFCPESATVRSNWDIESNWDLMPVVEKKKTEKKKKPEARSTKPTDKKE